MYIANHKGLALVGTPESLVSARILEERGRIRAVGYREGKIYYRITSSGLSVTKPAFRLGDFTKILNGARKTFHGYFPAPRRLQGTYDLPEEDVLEDTEW